MAHLLIVDENSQYCERLSKVMHNSGFRISQAHSLREGFRLGKEHDIDVVLLTSLLPDGSGTDNLQRFRNTPAAPEVIIMADYADADEAELAISNGAWDYVLKSRSPKQLIEPLSHLANYREKRKHAQNNGAVASGHHFSDIIGSSMQLRSCLDMLSKAGRSDTNVLLTGETGTGKELFAVALHSASRRAKNNFVVVDCTALPETLVESTLFGHEKGSFTGATRNQSGLVKQADGGTLFLDEVGEMPLSLQKSFLRVLQEHRFRPVGGEREISSDFRLVAATNKDLDAMVAAGNFRSDLLFRLRTFAIRLPSLGDRGTDRNELTSYFLNRLCQQNGIPEKIVSRDFMRALAKYSWPGNVRELFHALERSVTAADDEPMLMAKHLPTYIRVCNARAALGEVDEEGGKDWSPIRPPKELTDPRMPLQKLQEVREVAIAEAEKRYLRRLMTSTGGNILEACHVSGLSRSRLYQLLKDYNIRPLMALEPAA